MFCVVRPAAVRGEEHDAPLAGAFSSVPFHPLPPGTRFDTRNPENSLFRLRPNPKSFAMVTEDEVDESEGIEAGEAAVPSRRSRGMCMTSELFQVGVPDTARIASSGLLLDATLCSAYCGPCDVYGGIPILGVEYERFTVSVVEVYGLALS